LHLAGREAVSGAAGGLRVLRIVTRLNVGGPTRQVISLTRDLGGPPGAAMLLAGEIGRGEGDWTSRAATLGSAFRLVAGLGRGLSPRTLAAAARSIRVEIRRFRPDVVHTHESRAGAIGRWAARRERVPVVVHTHHGHVLRSYFGPALSAGLRLVERRLAAMSDALVVPAPEIADELALLGVAGREKFVPIAPGLDVAEHLAGPVAPDPTCRSRLGIAADAPVVGFVGRLVPVKDPLLFVAAARRVLLSFPDTVFLVAGDGPLRSAAEHATGNDCRAFRFLGFREDPLDLLRALDVFAVTSRHEGLPASLVEAMACGAAPVASKVGGIPGLVDHGVSGRLFPPGDAAAAAEAIVFLLASRAEREREGAAARRAIRERGYSPAKMARELASLYERLVARRGAP